MAKKQKAQDKMKKAKAKQAKQAKLRAKVEARAEAKAEPANAFADKGSVFGGGDGKGPKSHAPGTGGGSPLMPRRSKKG